MHRRRACSGSGFSGWGSDHRDIAATEQRISNGRPVAGNLNTRIRF